MGFFSGIKNALFGKKSSPSGYKSPYLGDTDMGARDVLAGMSGATALYKKDKKGNIKYDKYGRPEIGAYDYRNVASPITGEAGIKKATSGYDFSPTDQAISGFKNPYSFSSYYKPSSYSTSYSPKEYTASKFDFNKLPDTYGKIAYDSAAKNIRREGDSSLAKIKQSVGVRNPGVLSKLARDNERQVDEILADKGSQIELERMRENVQLGKEQQLSQAEEDFRAAGFNDEQARALAAEQLASADFNAGENYRGYQSQSDLEGRQADENFRNLDALNRTGMEKIAAQSGLVDSERANQNQIMEYLLSLLGAQTNASANYNPGGQRSGGLLGTAASLAGSAARGFSGG